MCNVDEEHLWKMKNTLFKETTLHGILVEFPKLCDALIFVDTIVFETHIKLFKEDCWGTITSILLILIYNGEIHVLE